MTPGTPPEYGQPLQHVIYVTRDEHQQIVLLAQRSRGSTGSDPDAWYDAWYEGLGPILGDRRPPKYTGPWRCEVTDQAEGWLDSPSGGS